MVQRAQSRADRTTLKQRREQVLERLAAFGLTRGPHRIVRASRRWDHEASLGLKLRLALSDLGPVFSSFGRYLATRVDLLPAADCLELEAIPDNATQMRYTDVVQSIENGIGCAPEEVFLSFESEPFESRLLYQLHHARLRQNGMPVVSKLVRPGTAAQLLCDLELLELVEGQRAALSLKMPLPISQQHCASRWTSPAKLKRWRRCGAMRKISSCFVCLR